MLKKQKSGIFSWIHYSIQKLGKKLENCLEEKSRMKIQKEKLELAMTWISLKLEAKVLNKSQKKEVFEAWPRHFLCGVLREEKCD